MQRSLIYLLYRLLELLAFPLLVVYLLVRGLRDREYFRRLEERFGILPRDVRGTVPGAIWLHAVSVGEVLATIGLLKRLRAEYPARRIYVTSTTLAGRSLAVEKLAGLADGVFYAPIDYCFAVRRVLRSLRPSVVIVAETEIWPNWYREIKRSGAGLLIVNGRISDKAFPRYRRWRWFFRAALSWPDAILAQSDTAAERYRQLGAPPDRVSNAGNLKYDFDPTGADAPEPVQRLLDRIAAKEIWVAASTMPPAEPADLDEDSLVIDAFRELSVRHERLLLVLVPRRPARFDSAADKLTAARVRFLRRSEMSGEEDLELPGVLLLDTIGELSGLFSRADIVFMGGTFPHRGGHNILEPAFFGKAIVTGPHMENFADIAHDFRANDGMVSLDDPGSLAGAIADLLADPGRRSALGRRAKELAEARRGATDRAMVAISRLSEDSISYPPRSKAVSLPLSLLSLIWGEGSAWKRTHQRGEAGRLNTPVISVGGISMGGAGKTPFALYLAEVLRRNGLRPAILTRGYGRRRKDEPVVLEAGSPAPSELTGDEPQILLRSGVADLGIGPRRLETGRLIEERIEPGVFVLDDGFQHYPLERDLDIVLIDALDPFGGGALFPVGRLREPPEELGRAHMFVITKASPGAPLAGIERVIRQHNDHAPIFHSRLVPVAWMDAANGTAETLEPVPECAAFCGLANPASFWRSLDELGCRPLWRDTFGDHYRYRDADLDRIAKEARTAGARTLLTTQKDLMNLPEGWEDRLAPLRLLWLRIVPSVKDEEKLLRLVLDRVHVAAGARS